MVGVSAIAGTPETADEVLDDLLVLEDQIESPQSDAYEDTDVYEPDYALG
jgi:hypothetical protein